MILEAYKRVIRKYLLSAIDQVKQQWSLYGDELGNAEILYIDESSAMDIIAFTLIAVGQKMWILEYGKGEYMASESENPFLAEYLSGDIYNTFRNHRGRKVLGRPKGPYLDLDGKIHTSTGKFDGVPLEELAFGRFLTKGIGMPKKPKFIIRNILFGDGNGGLISEMEKELQQLTVDMVRDIFATFPQRIVIME